MLDVDTNSPAFQIVWKLETLNSFFNVSTLMAFKI